MAKPKARSKANIKVLGVTEEQKLSDYTAWAMKEYGTEVVEQRAIPDYRDGLKPVHRYILWAAYKLGCHHTSGFKKSARIVGDVIGKYHPHGDMSCYQAMVGMAGVKDKTGKDWHIRNTPVPLIEGYGNWGSHVDSAAAYRYSEARLSRFSDLMLLDPEYLAVSEMVYNFSQDELVPLVLPAKLPIMLLNGSISIAVGVAASCPSFHIDGVKALAKIALQGKTITPQMCLKHLQFEYPYGGECISEDAEILELFKKGYGSIAFAPSYKKEGSNLIFTSVCPGLMSSGSVSNFLEKIASIKGVKSVYDGASKGEVIKYVVELKNAGPDTEQAILDASVRVQRYDIGITIRQPEGAKFQKITVPKLFELWAKWRIELELKALARLIKLQQDKLERLQLLLLAVDNLDVIIKALKVKEKTVKVKVQGVLTDVDASAHYLMKHLAITLDEANYILDLKVRQLKAIERATVTANIKAVKTEIKTLQAYTKKPHERIINDLNTLKL